MNEDLLRSVRDDLLRIAKRQLYLRVLGELAGLKDEAPFSAEAKRITDEVFGERVHTPRL